MLGILNRLGSHTLRTLLPLFLVPLIALGSLGVIAGLVLSLICMDFFEVLRAVSSRVLSRAPPPPMRKKKERRRKGVANGSGVPGGGVYHNK